MFIAFRKRGREGERERNIDVRNTDQLLPTHAPTWDHTHNVGMCPDLESNPRLRYVP